MVKQITHDEFNTLVAHSDKPVLVDFFATWCGPCRMMAPVLDQISDEVADSAVVYKVDIDENPQLAAQFGIMSVPTLMVFKEGKAVNMFVGMQPKQTLVDALR
ncbi:MAG: thioredoxin [Anaerotardibacter sp.]